MSREILQRTWSSITPEERFNLFTQWINARVETILRLQISLYRASLADDRLFYFETRSEEEENIYQIRVSTALFDVDQPAPDAALEIGELILTVLLDLIRRAEMDNARKIENDYWKQFDKLRDEYLKEYVKDIGDVLKDYVDHLKFLYPDLYSST